MLLHRKRRRRLGVRTACSFSRRTWLGSVATGWAPCSFSACGAQCIVIDSLVAALVGHSFNS
jgi:hypothetical protein